MSNQERKVCALLNFSLSARCSRLSDDFFLVSLRNIITGAVSAEGTAASVVGGLALSLYGWFVGFISAKAIPISVFAAFVATNIESVIGATLQGKKNFEWMTNEVVNFINTLIGAGVAIAIGMAFL